LRDKLYPREDKRPSMPREETTLNTWAIAVARVLESRNVDPRPLFIEAGLSPSVLHDPNGRHPVPAMGRLWTLAVGATNDPCLGLHAAQYVQPTTFVTLGLAILASDTLGDAMRRGARFSRIMTDAADLTTTETKDGLVQTLRTRSGTAPVPEAIDLYMASTVKMGRLLTGTDVLGTRIWRRMVPSPAIAAQHEAFFGIPIEFGADADSFMISHEVANRPLPMANPALALASDSAIRAYLARFDGSRLADRVREAVITKLSSGEPQRAAIARTLHLGEKTLQRRLADEGTSFQKLVDETRHELAERYVRDVELPLAEVAFRLGFAEQSGFTRAFKRWTGKSPSEFRESR
jgi:AraC-like DNA-binding protein